MFKILGGADAFEQWALDQKVTNEHMKAGDKVLFHSASGKVCPMYAYDDGGVVVNVPNELLQQARPIVVDLAGRPACRTTFNVNPHDKPEGYDDIYTETETHAPGDLASRVAVLEAGGGSGGGGRIETTETVVYDRKDIECWESNGGWQSNWYPMTGDNYFVLENKTYIVEFEGVKYTPKTIVPGYIYVGNASLLDPSMDDTGEPFVMRRDGTEFTIFTTLPGGSYDIKITVVETNLVFDGDGGFTNIVHIGSDDNYYLGTIAMGDAYPCTPEMIAAMIDRFGYVFAQEPIPADNEDGLESGLSSYSITGYGKLPDGTIVVFD